MASFGAVVGARIARPAGTPMVQLLFSNGAVRRRYDAAPPPKPSVVFVCTFGMLQQALSEAEQDAGAVTEGETRQLVSEENGRKPVKQKLDPS